MSEREEKEVKSPRQAQTARVKLTLNTVAAVLRDTVTSSLVPGATRALDGLVRAPCVAVRLQGIEMRGWL